MEALLQEHRRYDGAHLGHTVDDCQKTIDLLLSARESLVAGGRASLLVQSLRRVITVANHDDGSRTTQRINDTGKAQQSLETIF